MEEIIQMKTGYETRRNELMISSLQLKMAMKKKTWKRKWKMKTEMENKRKWRNEEGNEKVSMRGNGNLPVLKKWKKVTTLVTEATMKKYIIEEVIEKLMKKLRMWN